MTSANLRDVGARALAVPRRHPLFAAAFAVASVLRIIAMLGYTPAMWFTDSYEYVSVALNPRPHQIRPDGYSFWLLLLKPFHSFSLVVFTQHLMGLATAVLIYLLLRRRFGLPAWGATLAAAPVLFDGYQIQLEHLILSDAMFTLIVVALITLLLWHRKPSLMIATWIGLLLALAALTRTIGLPILALVVAYLIVKRVGWRPITAVVVVCAAPVLAYMAWFASVFDGRFAMTNSDGVILYMRTAIFADCAKMNPEPELVPLCIKEPVDKRTESQRYLWNDYESPLHRLGGYKFNAYQNEVAGRFAREAILKQPGDYLAVVARDFMRTFQWDRPIFPDRKTWARYQFRPLGAEEKHLPKWRVDRRGGTAAEDAARYEAGNPETQVVAPWAGIMQTYQGIFFLRGTLLGGILLIGLAGIVVRWRKLGGPVLLPWLAAVGLLLAPAATAEFDYRYVLPAVPLACLAAAITLRHGLPWLRLPFLRRADSTPPPASPPLHTDTRVPVSAR
ncbi:hypothetical protein [Rhizohabitans arisaemae]|uniref:hypothetical protein n=1 Tax=Rhizohabitans arisaemae TaxID=2720610 RepID=UPI0024B03FF4|nr:hypothetical protein [Rhizohabitans arisaemae]